MLKVQSFITSKSVAIFDTIKGANNAKRLKIESKDIAQLKSLSKFANSLNIAPLHSKHPLRQISLKLKNEITKYETATQVEVILFSIIVSFGNWFLGQFLDLIEKYTDTETSIINFSEVVLEDEENQLSDVEMWRLQSFTRLLNLKYYIHSLKDAIKTGELSPSKLSSSVAMLLIDTSLLGSGAERVSSIVLQYY